MGPVKHKKLQLMEYYAEHGRNLRDVVHLVGVSWDTALKWCRHHNIYFPDHKRRKRKEHDDG